MIGGSTAPSERAERSWWALEEGMLGIAKQCLRRLDIFSEFLAYLDVTPSLEVVACPDDFY